VDKGKSLCRKLAFRAEFAENTKLTKTSYFSCYPDFLVSYPLLS